VFNYDDADNRSPVVAGVATNFAANNLNLHNSPQKTRILFSLSGILPSKKGYSQPKKLILLLVLIGSILFNERFGCREEKQKDTFLR